MTDNQRSQDRKGVALLVQLKHPDVGTFAEQWATNLSPGGMFIRTRKPQAVGTQLRFEVKIAEGVRVMRGVATVRWVRGENDPAGPAGMGLQFSALDAETRALVERMLVKPERSRAQPTAPAPAAIPTIAPVAPAAPSVAPLVPSIAPVVPSVAPIAATPVPRAETPVPRGQPPGARASQTLPPIAPVIPPVAPSIAPMVASAAITPLPIDIAEAPPEPASDVVDLPLDLLMADLPAIAPDAPVDDEPLGMEGFDLAFDDEPMEVAPPVDPGPPALSPLDLLPEPLDLDEVPLASADEGFELEELEFEPEPEPKFALPEPFPKKPTPPPPAPVAQAPTAPPALPGRRRILFLEPPATIPDDGPVLGIDLGTSNSCVAFTREGKPTVIRSKDGYNTVPSVVSLTDKGKLFVGHRARGQLVLHPQHTILGAKRLVGRRFDNAVVKQVREHYHYEICPDAEGTAAVRLRGQIVSLAEIQGLVLRECKQMAEDHFGRGVHRAVVTVPAYYSEPQREAVREAGRLAGLRVERILNEPTAAALAYGLNRQLTRRVLVYDLGGGTFDATVLKVDANVFEVLATGGDTFLGGVDFDNAVVDALLQRFEQQEGIAFTGDGVALSRVAEAAEQAKMALSERTTHDVELPMLMMDAGGQPRSMRITLTRDELNDICRPMVERSLDVVRDVLLDARLRASDIDDVILVGGQSRMPLVRESLKGMFGKAPHAAVNADEAVALGAALYAGTLEKVSNVVLIDVLPMTVGLGLPGGQFKRLLERNTPLPAQHGFTVGTGRDGERAIELHLFQGEDGNVGGNEYLGTVRIDGLPASARGKEQIAVSLRLDTECVLHVDARHLNGKAPLEVSLSARYDAAQLQRLLGYGEEATRVDAARAEELTSRAGRFWNRLKKAIGR